MARRGCPPRSLSLPIRSPSACPSCFAPRDPCGLPVGSFDESNLRPGDRRRFGRIPHLGVGGGGCFYPRGNACPSLDLTVSPATRRTSLGNRAFARLDGVRSTHPRQAVTMSLTNESTELRLVVTHTLIVGDIPRSVAFYRDVLGATVLRTG